MRFSEEFRERALVEQISARLREGHARIMEVCGTHTMSIARFGLKSLLPDDVRLVSGPGCPVCVTDQQDIDAYLSLGRLPSVTLVSFGDMLRVPGSETSLERLRAAGSDVRVVYSPLDAVEIARTNPDSQVVFFGVGFETTMPAVALAVTTAADQGVGNFSVYCVHKTVPAALRALFVGGGSGISGLLLPGHVTTIIGAEAYDFLARDLRIPCAVAGFEPVDIMLGVESILNQIADGQATVHNVYARAVTKKANPLAAQLFADVFEPCDAIWRGIGTIPGSGMRLRGKYSAFDALSLFADTIAKVPPAKPSGCICGQVLRGVISPDECPLFGGSCTPESPVGPCMVSSEGACAAAFKYGGT